MGKTAFCISFDNVKIFEGDDFYILHSYPNKGRTEYCIKYWNSQVMESLESNRVYLTGKLIFSFKDELHNYIIENNLEVTNFNHIFDKEIKTK